MSDQKTTLDCIKCGKEQYMNHKIRFTSEIDGTHLVIENLYIGKCPICGDEVFTPEAQKQIDKAVLEIRQLPKSEHQSLLEKAVEEVKKDLLATQNVKEAYSRQAGDYAKQMLSLVAEVQRLREALKEISGGTALILSDDFIEAIQLDAIKEGMRRAAEMVRVQPIHSDFSLQIRGGNELMAEKIFNVAEQLK